MTCEAFNLQKKGQELLAALELLFKRSTSEHETQNH
jgi:hypothetical protein